MKLLKMCSLLLFAIGMTVIAKYFVFYGWLDNNPIATVAIVLNSMGTIAWSWGEEASANT